MPPAARTIFIDARVVRVGATGVGSWTAGVLSGLDDMVAQGAPVRVVALRLSGAGHAIWDSLRSVDVVSTGVDYESHPRGDLFLQRDLVPLALRCGAESLVSPAFQAPVMAARGRSPVRRIVVVHDLFVFDREVPTAAGFRWYMRAMVTAALARCEAVATSSAVMRAALSERSGIQTVFAPPAIDHRVFRPTERGAVLPDGTPRRAPLLLYTANFEPRKNHKVLFDAVRRSGWDLVLLHGAEWRGATLPTGVRVVAPRGIAEIAAWTAAADVAVFPSSVEGFGIPMLEALACGTPLLAADIGAARWLTGGGRAARLVPADDSAAWRRAIGAMLDGSDLAVASRVRAGLRRARGFTWEQSARRLLRGAFPRDWQL